MSQLLEIKPVRRGRFAALCFALAWGGASCGGTSGDPEVEIGTGTTDFVAIDDSGEVELELIAGPQGGHHFITHARIRNMRRGDPTMPGLIANPQTSFEVYDADGTRVDFEFPPYRLGYVERDDGYAYLASGRITAIEDGEVERYYGTTMRLVVRVRDVEGRTAQSERTITAIEGAVLPGADAGPEDAAVDAGVPDGSPP